MKWVTNQNYSDSDHDYYDFEFSSSLTPLCIHARVFWKHSEGGWWYGFPGKVGFGIYGPFETHWKAINECDKKIKTDIQNLIVEFGGMS